MTSRAWAQVGNDQFVDVLRQEASPAGIADWQARLHFALPNSSA